MNITIWVIIASFILYKCGVVRLALEKFRLADNEGYEIQEQHEEIEDTREILEQKVISIMEQRGLGTSSIKYMSNRIMREIISEYEEQITS